MGDYNGHDIAFGEIEQSGNWKSSSARESSFLDYPSYNRSSGSSAETGNSPIVIGRHETGRRIRCGPAVGRSVR